MTVDIALWIIAAIAIINAVLICKYRVPADMAAKKQSIKPGVPIFITIGSFILMGLWIWVGYTTGYYQIIVWIVGPWLIHSGAQRAINNGVH